MIRACMIGYSVKLDPFVVQSQEILVSYSAIAVRIINFAPEELFCIGYGKQNRRAVRTGNKQKISTVRLLTVAADIAGNIECIAVIPLCGIHKITSFLS